MGNALVKGSGLGEREWREDFQLIDENGTVQFKVAKTTGAVTMAGAPAITGVLDVNGGIDMSSSSPAGSAIDMEGMTLASNKNAIRGASVNPTRTSGWISFSGTVSTSPSQVYTDYRNLTTTGTAEVLGIGSFPMMASGASCAGMVGLQSICQLDSGSTWLTGGGTSGTGIFPVFAKLTQTSATINSGAQGAAVYADVNANVSDISGQNIANIWCEASSGKVRDMFYCKSTSHAGWTNMFNLAAADEPFVATGCSVTVATVPYLRVLVGSTVYGIPLIAI